MGTAMSKNFSALAQCCSMVGKIYGSRSGMLRSLASDSCHILLYSVRNRVETCRSRFRICMIPAPPSMASFTHWMMTGVLNSKS